MRPSIRIDIGVALPRMQARHPDTGIGLVHRAIGFDAQIIFRAA